MESVNHRGVPGWTRAFEGRLLAGLVILIILAILDGFGCINL